MARSAIIKDLANSTVDTMTALKRAKVLFAELGNDDLLEWVSGRRKFTRLQKSQRPLGGVVHQRINGITYEVDKCIITSRENA